MDIRYLTPSEQELYDPTNSIRNLTRARSGKSHYEAPSKYFRITPQEIFDRYTQLMERIRSQANKRITPYLEYNSSLYSKYGPQGGAFDRQQMMDKLRPYFDKALRSIEIHPVLQYGADYLVALIRDIKSRVGGISYSIPSTWKTFAGSPTALHKGDYLAETVGAAQYRHAYPTIMGQRRMRGKDRLIFMDSVLNVRIMESWLQPVRNWLKTYLPQYFGSWLNPNLEVHPRTYKAVLNHNYIIESDYEQMDASFSYEVVDRVVLPVYRELLADQWTPFLEAHLIECFHQPVFGIEPGTLIEGKHNLFSGIGCTNDFETIYTVALAIGVSLYYDCLDNIDILALGDDMRACLSKTTPRFAHYWFDTFKEVSTKAGLFVHGTESGKSWVGSGSCRYLRRVYYPGAKMDDLGNIPGAYPSVLVLNNIVQPEYPSKSAGLAALADLQRLDNMQTNPEYNEFLGLIARFCTHSFLFTEEDEAKRDTDWWERVYGEKWNPMSSFTYRRIQDGALRLQTKK